MIFYFTEWNKKIKGKNKYIIGLLGCLYSKEYITYT